MAATNETIVVPPTEDGLALTALLDALRTKYDIHDEPEALCS